MLQTKGQASRFLPRLLLVAVSLGTSNTYASTDNANDADLTKNADYFEELRDNWWDGNLSETVEEEETPKAKVRGMNTSFQLNRELLKTLYNPDLPKLDIEERKKVVLTNIFSQHPYINWEFFGNRAHFDSTSWRDLNVLTGPYSDKEKTLLNTVSDAQTIFGKAFLATTLTSPTLDLEKIKTRQKKIRALGKNAEIRESLKNEIGKTAVLEETYVSLFSKKDVLFDSDYSRNLEDTMLHNWPGMNALNKQQWPLELKKRLRIDLPLVSINFLSLILFASPTIVPGLAPLAPWYYALGALNVYSTYEFTKNYISQLEYLKTRLSHLGAVVESMNSVRSILEENGLTQVFADEYSLIQGVFNSDDPEIRELTKLLRRKSLLNKNLVFSNSSEAIRSYVILKEKRAKLYDLFVALGSIDNFVGITEKVGRVNKLKKDAQYSFATFSDASSPMIEMTNMWNPYINPEYVVVNQVSLGQSASRLSANTVILTGPNAGGKSTYMTGTAIGALLAQTVGVVPASKHKQTPYAMINTYMNVTDDIAAGNSLFMAEVLRAQKHIETINSLQEGEFSFTIFDELFTGTNPVEGAAASYSIAKKIAKNSNSNTMLATHFSNLTRLEFDLGSSFVENYKVSIKKGSDGKIIYPYIISKGASDQNIAIDILEQQGFDPEMIEEARRIVEQGL